MPNKTPLSSAEHPQMSSTPDLSTLRRKRGRILSALTSFTKFIDAQTEAGQCDHNLVQEHLDGMIQQWSKFDEILLDPWEESRNFEIREKYYAIVSRAKQLINARQPTSSSNPLPKPIATPMAVTLPEISLSTFNGAPKSWASFFDVFSSVIDRNEDLTFVQKLQYLRSTLGKATTCIESLATTDVNYVSALNLLKDKFDNPRKTIMRHCSAILELPKLT